MAKVVVVIMVEGFEADSGRMVGARVRMPCPQC